MLSEQPPRGRTGRIEPRSPEGRPGGHIRSGWSVSRFGPSDTLVGVRLAHWPVPRVCGMVPVELAAASPRAGLPLQAGWPLPSRSIPGRYRRSSRVSLRLSPGRPVVDLQAGRFSHFTAAPQSILRDLTLGRAASSSPRRLPRSIPRRTADDGGTAIRIHGVNSSKEVTTVWLLNGRTATAKAVWT